MRITITKGDTNDRLEIERADGSTAFSRFPHKGPVPHDFVHFAVERALGIDGGFWGLVARGHHPEDIQDIAKAAGHASAKRADIPAGHFVPAIQAERIVEAFEADHWSGGAGDPAGVAYMAESGCGQSLVPPIPMDDSTVTAIRGRIAAFAAQWTALPVGRSLELEWPDPR